MDFRVSSRWYIMIIKIEDSPRLSITKNTIDWLNIYFGRSSGVTFDRFVKLNPVNSRFSLSSTLINVIIRVFAHIWCFSSLIMIVNIEKHIFELGSISDPPRLTQASQSFIKIPGETFLFFPVRGRKSISNPRLTSLLKKSISKGLWRGGGKV
jgi:hypothetical protein